MDPLFERRQLTKNVHINSNLLQKNIQASLLAQLRMNYEGKCSPEGFIQNNSITITNYSLGRTNYIKGGIDYQVQFQADVCFLHPGQRLKAPVTLRSKVGIHAETPPIKVLIPRDLHLGNAEFESVTVGEDVEFEVIGSQFKQQDKEIIVLGKLLSKIVGAVEEPLLIARPAEPITVSSSFGPESSSEEKQITIVPTIDSDKPKKRKLKLGGSEIVNDEQVLKI